MELQLQSHVYAWAITFLLFITTLILIRADKPKAQKITHMILRLFLLFTLLTGIGLVASIGWMGTILIKAALGIILLFFIEMIITKTRDHEPVVVWWVAFGIDVILIFYYVWFQIGWQSF